MIVSCANCQTRFRLADERVTARGLKVRCSRCGGIFVVHREEPAGATEPLPPPPGLPDDDLGFRTGTPPPDDFPAMGIGASATAPREAAAATAPESAPLEPALPEGLPAPAGSFDGSPWPDGFAAEPALGRQPLPSALAPAPIPDLPGLPGGGPRPAPPAPPEAPAPAIASGPSRPAEAVASPGLPRAPVTFPSTRRRERPPTGGVVAALHVVAGAALLAGILFAVAPSGDAGGGRTAEVIRLFTGDPGAPRELEPVELRAAIRETATGERSLVVAGAVESRREHPALPILVTAELVDGDRVLAREEAMAGSGAGRVPFELVFREVPPGLARAALRVTARYGAAAPEAPAPEVSARPE